MQIGPNSSENKPSETERRMNPTRLSKIIDLLQQGIIIGPRKQENKVEQVKLFPRIRLGENITLGESSSQT